MRQISRHSTGLNHHFTRYNLTDAREDNRHVPARELPKIVRETNAGREYRPLRKTLRTA